MATSIVFATIGRPDILRAALGALAHQTVKPDSVIISCASDADLCDRDRLSGAIILKGPASLTLQRNAALRALPPSTQIVAFLDDDYVPDDHWIEVVERYFTDNAEVVCITGNVLADGINGPGLTMDDARRVLSSADYRQANWSRRPYSPYGCNMAIRVSALTGLSFDERLVLYGWQEDRDLGAQLAKRGATVQLGSAMGVHLGVKRSRVSGRKLGYSQIANPVYLYKKGTMNLETALSHASKNFAANLVRSLWSEPYIDRRGRLRGNFVALWDTMRGRAYPERAESL